MYLVDQLKNKYLIMLRENVAEKLSLNFHHRFHQKSQDNQNDPIL